MYWSETRGNSLVRIADVPTGLFGGFAESWLVRYASASLRCESDLDDDAKERLCLNCSTGSGAVSDRDCWLTTMAVQNVSQALYVAVG